ncbi:MAG TPA: glycosyltransferase [Candidatus Bathyarchaeia archaeon]|nr:glycosyltransferase [Candidatus Bathyarchaeia archaeon]
MKRIKLAVVSHALVQEVVHKRWRLLAQKFPVEVTLIVPKVWRARWLVDEFVFRPRSVEEEHFRVLPLPTTTTRYWGKYFFCSRDMGFKSLSPDVIYTIQEELLWVHQQVIRCRNAWAPDARMLFFSMNALGVPQQRWDQQWRWRWVKENYDAALGHYPGCLKSLREAGFKKPVFLQTQVGIDEALYEPDESRRQEMRVRLGLHGRFVVGYAGRLTRDKGLDVLMASLSMLSGNWALLLLGNGDYRLEIERMVQKRGWQDRVMLAGTVDQREVADYLRAMDCFVIGSRTRPGWIDTFPNALVQAMACGVAVVGSDSGAIPYIIQDAGIVVPEGDVEKTAEAIQHCLDDGGQRISYGQKARARAVVEFGAEALAQHFYGILQQVTSGNYRTGLDDHHQEKAWM